MTLGWVRAWAEEETKRTSRELRNAHDRALFRQGFRTPLRRTAADDGENIRDLAWGDSVELLDWPSAGPWTRVRAGGDEGFVATAHLVEVAFVKKGSGKNALTARLTRDDGDRVDLLWGDLVQVLARDGTTARVRVRGMTGTIAESRLTAAPLLEVYFIDVGQGDGVLVRTPDGRHMLIDGGLPRSNQLTGKNAADFVDWKFFEDYGDHAIRLDAMVASHSDYDHYGGLWDLVRMETAEDRELDCLSVGIGTFYHPGLARWEKRSGTPFPHKDDLGPNDQGWFVRLLEDRADVDTAIVNGADEELGGYWKRFIADVVERNPGVGVTRLGVAREALQDGGTLPHVWADAGGCRINVMAPVTVERDGRPALKDLGDTGQNSNGHSVCLRLDHGNARILLTGDLNTASMDWLIESYGDRIAAFNCDVFKACHHGSGDVSYRFLEQVRAAATVISSGDAEGYAHPRPEIVAASATTGYLEIDRQADRLVTPLVYMTEIERSAGLGEVSHIGFTRYPVENATIEGALFAKPFDEIPDNAFLEPADRDAIETAPDKATGRQLKKDAVRREKAELKPLAAAQKDSWTRAQYHFREVRGPFSIRYGNRSIWRSRIMTKNHYGLVNIRTDGETVMCATMKEEGGGWTVHSFAGRFQSPG